MSWNKYTEPIGSLHNRLEIRKTTYNDSGNYVCTAKSVLGEMQKQVKLFVEGKYILVKKVCHTVRNCDRHDFIFDFLFYLT